MANFSWADFADRLSELGWRQKDFVSRSGVAASTVSAWRVRDRVPQLAIALLDEWVRRRRLSDELGDGLAPQPNRPRGKPFDEGGRHARWERSAADYQPTEVETGIRKRLQRQEDADMDQDSGEYGRG